MAWVEGSIAPRIFVRRFAEILCTTNKMVADTIPVTGEVMATTDYYTYQTEHRPIDAEIGVTVYVDGTEIEDPEGVFTVDYQRGEITFEEEQNEAEDVTIDYTALVMEVDPEKNWELIYPDPDDFKERISLGEQPMTPDEEYTVYTAENSPWDRGYSVLVFIDDVITSRFEYEQHNVTGEVLVTEDQLQYSSQHSNWAEGDPEGSNIEIYINGDVVTPETEETEPVVDETLTTEDQVTYTAANANWDPFEEVTVTVNDDPPAVEYEIDFAGGQIIFDSSLAPEDVVEASYSYIGSVIGYEVDYGLGSITFNEPLAESDIVTADYEYETSIEVYSIDYSNGAVVFNEPLSESETVTASYTYIDEETDGKEEAMASITSRAVLKTATTPALNDQGEMESLEMYLDIEKPEVLLNVETGTANFEDIDGLAQPTPPNYHGIRLRLIDQWDRPNKRPSGEAYVSAWTSLDWYRTFEDRLVTLINDDPDKDRIEDGIAYIAHPLVSTANDVPIAYWGNVDNDRIGVVLLGSPGVTLAHYLSSFLYVGSMESFEGGEPDIQGNFILTASNSQRPCATADVSIEPPEILNISAPHMTYPPDGQTWELTRWRTGSQGQHRWWRRTLDDADPLDMLAGSVRYRIQCVRADEGVTLPSESVEQKWLVGDRDPIYSDWPYEETGNQPGYGPSLVFTPGTDSSGNTLTIQVPRNVVEVRIYRTLTEWSNLATESETADAATPVHLGEDHILIDTVSVSELDREQIITWTDTHKTPTPSGESFVPPELNEIVPMHVRPVRRNPDYNTVYEVTPPSAWGQATAAGNTDILVYKTYPGELYQRHEAHFISPGEGQISNPFQPSLWTGMYHVCPIVVTHPVDGERGTLRDCLAVFDRAIVYGDVVYVDKDTPNEKKYRFFRITAPYHFLVNSPNPVMGVAIRME